jgi:outer membrane protein insertion porin family
VAPGFGFRISIPALGPAPLAFDLAFPVAKAETDDERMFTFFFGMGR